MKGIIILILVVSVLVLAYADDEVTITTYYPSPQGVYRNLQLSPTSVPTSGFSRGSMFFNNSLDMIQLYNNSGWQTLYGGSGTSAAIGNLTCQIVTGAVTTAYSTPGYYYGAAVCPANTLLTGGGANCGLSQEPRQNYPQGPQRWFVVSNTASGTCTAYAVCCNITH